MSVVGLTFGSGANATRPSAASAASVATSASTFEDGCARSYQREAGGERARTGRRTRRAPSSRRDLHRQAAAERSRALLGGRAAAPHDPRGLGGEVPAAGEHLGGRAVGDRAAVGEQDDALARTRPRTRRRGWRRARRRRRARARAGGRRARPCAARSMPRVGSSRQTAAGGSPPPMTIASARRWRSPPERSRGWRSAERGEADGVERRGGRLVADALVQQVVVRVLEQQRDAPGGLDAPARRLLAGRRGGAAASTCPRRCGP